MIKVGNKNKINKSIIGNHNNSSKGNNVLIEIIIGVVVGVIVAAIVYYLGWN